MSTEQRGGPPTGVHKRADAAEKHLRAEQVFGFKALDLADGMHPLTTDNSIAMPIGCQTDTHASWVCLQATP